MGSPSLLDLSFDQLRSLLAQRGVPGFRAQQIWHAIFRERAATYAAMSTLPKALRDEMQTILPWGLPSLAATVRSRDRNTAKLLLSLHDGEAVETVIMKYARGLTACISTQIGCRMACAFCATGQSGFVRDLTASEIICQVLCVVHYLEDVSPSRLVYMGMGEPLDNYESTLQSIRTLHDHHALGISARAITVSTVGIVPGILRLAKEGLPVTLAVSLHTVNSTLRDTLIPINHRYPVDDLLEACRTYTATTRRRLSFEVTLIDGLTDSETEATLLGKALQNMLCHVNLIPFNPIAGCPWKPSPSQRVVAFQRVLASMRIPVSVRHRRGGDIQAGCGQLRAQAPPAHTIKD